MFDGSRRQPSLLRNLMGL